MNLNLISLLSSTPFFAGLILVALGFNNKVFNFVAGGILVVLVLMGVLT